MDQFILSFTKTNISSSLSDQSIQSFPTYQKLLKALTQGIHDRLIQYQNSPGEYHDRIVQKQTLKADMLRCSFDEINEYLIGCQIYELTLPPLTE